VQKQENDKRREEAPEKTPQRDHHQSWKVMTDQELRRPEISEGRERTLPGKSGIQNIPGGRNNRPLRKVSCKLDKEVKKGEIVSRTTERYNSERGF
jgi:hypothetical protein